MNFERTRRNARVPAWFIAGILFGAAAAGVAALPFRFSANTPIVADDVMENFDDLDRRLASLERATAEIQAAWAPEALVVKHQPNPQVGTEFGSLSSALAFLQDKVVRHEVSIHVESSNVAYEEAEALVLK